MLLKAKPQYLTAKESWKTKHSVTLNLDMFHPSQLAELDL